MKHTLEPMSKVMTDLKKKGFTHEFRLKDGMLTSPNDSSNYSHDKIFIVEEYRFEGASNPDDLAILYTMQTTDGKKGIVINNYGPNSDLELNEFIKQCETRK